MTKNFDRANFQPPAVASKRRQAQRGSALLVVLVFAAVIAIMLYRELPIAAFEAQRQKEQLLVSRGNEYKRGVKLFVRKIGRFPSSIEELESTNRMRFLRHRYVDPLTGKDDWRIIHAGPGGTIIDSQVKSSTDGKNSSQLGQAAVFGGFNNSFSGDAAAAAADNTPVSAGMRQRPAATQNAGSVNNDPLAAAVAGIPPGTDATSSGTPGSSTNQQVGFDPVTGQAYANNTQSGSGTNGNGGAGISTVSQQLNNVNPQMPEKSPAQQGATVGNTSAFNNSPNSLTGNQGNGLIGAAGGIAGVASKAEGKSIKTVNDQTKYKLWEFYYDLRKDQSAGAGAGLGGQQNANGNANGANGVGGQNGANGSGGVFGQTNSSGGGFGQTQPQGQSSSFGFGGNNQPQQTLPTTTTPTSAPIAQ